MCPNCHQQFVPDFPGLNPKGVQFFQDEDEVFILHERCAEEIQRKAQALKSEKQRQTFYSQLLNRLSAA